MRQKEELDFEDVVFHRADEPEHLELPLSRQAFLLVGAVVIAIVSVILFRIVFLNVGLGGIYAARSTANAHKEIDLPAPRGIVRDRYGEPLVRNDSSFSIFINLADLIRSGEKLDRTLVILSEILGVKKSAIEEIIKNSDLERKVFIPIARNITSEQAAVIKERRLPFVQLVGDYSRTYLDPLAFAHVLGYVGASETSNEIIGRAGLEAQYDSIIRGSDGRFIVYRDAIGKELDTKIVDPPRLGSDLVTTLDAGLQKYFYERMQKTLQSLGRQAGVGLAMDPRTGEILAMISLPSFNSNEVAQYLNASGQPLFNRAISGAYTPGSTIKPLVALSALKEGIVATDFQILSTGSIEIANPYDPEKPSRFLDWKAHGWVDLYSAIARSSNIYFYALGGGLPKANPPLAGLSASFKGLGIEKLGEYWKKFAFGRKTGIDLPGEQSGFLPNPSEKESRTGEIWRLGDTYNTSIGQGDLLVTPLQLLNFIASIANGGKIYRPRLTQSVPEVLADYTGWEGEIKAVQKGMEDAVSKPYGTANWLAHLPTLAAGKTGSAQVANNTRTNAFFVGYMPAPDPQIAVLVLIENAKEGSLNAVPIANDVLRWYYDNRINNAKIAN